MLLSQSLRLFCRYVIGFGLLACEVPTIDSGSGDAAARSPSMLPAAQRLLVLEEAGPPVLLELGLEGGRSRTWLETPSLSFVYELSINRALESVFLAYTPPPVSELERWSYRSGIYRLDISQMDDQSGPQDTGACPDEPDVYCYYPASYGNRLWFVRTTETSNGQPNVQLRELNLDTSENRLVSDWATEPAVSPDGQHLTWITIDPVDGRRTLVLATIDGEVVRTLVAFDSAEDIGLPFFAADGKSVFYLRIPLTSSWWQGLGDWLIKPAYAHNDHALPGDWWRVPVSGALPTQVTQLQTVHYDGQADPSGESLFIATMEGVRQVDLRSGETRELMLTRAARALDWL